MGKVKFGIVVFPGSNCDHDSQYVAGHVMEQEARLIWHKESSLGDVDVVILPGGFAHGDYLRCGAIARFSPIMKDVVRFANNGGAVLGICNGFQVLTEAGLLPGVLLRNSSLRFICRYVNVRVENNATMFTAACRKGDVLEIPVAHGDGNFFAEEETVQKLVDNNQIVFKYCTKEGDVSDEANPNGSRLNIAGIINEAGNVLGLMPHPERAADPVLRHTDGQAIFQSIIQSFLGVDATREPILLERR
ncbi:MAG TPA: phosphoribosylformylglycinamidine synthase subunit PurQ [Bacteroidota bacterium]